jgi:4-hydroxy 2-oxovalerate aldolase
MGYLNQNFGRDYDVEPLLTITDDVISRFKEKNNWGYSLPYYLSGIYGVHPSYILTFMERKTLNSRDIKQRVDMISDDKRSEFDLEYAKELYNVYNNKVVDDEDSRKQLTKLIGGRKVLLLGPGKSIRENVDRIKNYIMKEKPFIIGINGEYELGPDAIFFSNKKRYENMELGSRKNTILTTSNIGGVKKGNLVFNYGTYLAKGCGVSDNALLMLLNILKAVKVEKVTVAGFDGYDTKENFYKGSLELLLDKNYVDELNKVIKENIIKLRDEMKIESITPSKNI